MVTGTCQKLIAFFKTGTGRILEWLWDQPHGGQFSGARAWPGAARLDQGTWQPNHLAKEPVTALLGCSEAEQIPVALLMFTWRLQSFGTPRWTSSSTDLGCDPLLMYTVIAALTAQSLAGYQRNSEELLFHRTVC